MHLAVYVPLVASLLLGGSARWLARWLPPRSGSWLMVGAGLSCAVATAVSVVALAATYVGHVHLLAAVGGWSVTRFDHADPVPPVAGMAAIVVGVVMAVLFSVAVTRALTQAVRSWRACRRIAVPGRILVVDDPLPDAYALPGGSRGRVVVSTGMLDALGPTDRRVLLAHETAHLRHRHHVLRLLTGIAAGLDPLLAGLPSAVRQLTERWADEDAAATVGDRRQVAEAIARAALASSRARRLAGSLRADGDVPRRVACLLAPHPRRGRAAVTVLAGLLVLSTVSAVEAGHDTDYLFDAAHLSHITHPTLQQVADQGADELAADLPSWPTGTF